MAAGRVAGIRPGISGLFLPGRERFSCRASVFDAVKVNAACSPGRVRERAEPVSVMVRKPREVYVFFDNRSMGRAAPDVRTMGEPL